MTEINRENSELPKGWVIVPMQKIAYQITDGTHKTPNYKNNGIRFISIKNIRPYKPINWESYEKYISEDEHQELIKRCKPEYDDILFPRIGTLGFAKRIDFKETVSIFVGLGLIKPHKNIVISKYVEYFMNSPIIYNLSHKKATGTGRKTLPLEESRRFPFLLPPLSEQHRIVDKIEELFSELDKGVELLKKSLKQLKIYRQAVLKSAFEGKLTEAWRTEHQDTLEDAQTLLTQIKAERECRYQQQLEEWKKAVKDWEANGKDGKKPTKPQKPNELPPLTEEELSELPSLPDGWLYVKAEEISDFITKGTTPSKNELFEDFGDIPFIKVYNLTNNGQLDFSIKPTFVSLATHQGFLSRSKVFPNDILMNIVGPPLGKVSLVPDKFKEWNINQAIVRYRVFNILLNKYLLYYLLSQVTIDRISKRAKATAGQFNLTLEICRDAEIPICSFHEQSQIVQEIESRLSICDQLETTITENIEKAEALRQSILKRAFEGKLVPQNPDDEPASELLKRIQAEKTDETSKNSSKQLELDVTSASFHS
ncbi:restriction endonuclease subunit S [Aphanothece hegewaldii CCALA 016]|uniref:Restriction endonuclease subunit S n=1 Tax=Aphanothece hegewaldii CCALA 016 TaxID=2107694 RepID=A0A2T1M021_9CHRO|nr:restriction endonuclease subunit S [Aphanothece hegewaldii]PSF37987.1 restriction endonuclease subunit S [Aphanothece hegewaldii CCALA 016]